jgi:hypothetical protein
MPVPEPGRLMLVLSMIALGAVVTPGRPAARGAIRSLLGFTTFHLDGIHSPAHA